MENLSVFTTNLVTFRNIEKDTDDFNARKIVHFSQNSPGATWIDEIGGELFYRNNFVSMLVEDGEEVLLVFDWITFGACSVIIVTSCGRIIKVDQGSKKFAVNEFSLGFEVRCASVSPDAGLIVFVSQDLKLFLCEIHKGFAKVAAASIDYSDEDKNGFGSGIMLNEVDFDGDTCSRVEEETLLQFHPLAQIEFGDILVSECVKLRDQFVNVGWGSKKTQFHGSEGKEAALREPSKVPLDGSHLCPEDLGSFSMKEYFSKISISWRGCDGEYFVVSAVSDLTTRQLFTFDKHGSLCSKSEVPVSCLLPQVAWQPNGTFIACPRRLLEHDNSSSFEIQLFERNGLKRYSFPLPKDVSNVLNLSWSLDSKILAILVLFDSNVKGVLFYSMSNYQWYCRYIFHNPAFAVQSLAFDSESALVVHLASDCSKILSITLCWEQGTDVLASGSDSIVYTISGKSIQLTPFATKNIPPPMYLETVQMPSHIAHSLCWGNSIWVLLASGDIYSIDKAGKNVFESRLVQAWNQEPLFFQSFAILHKEDEEEVSFVVHASSLESGECFIFSNNGCGGKTFQQKRQDTFKLMQGCPPLFQDRQSRKVYSLADGSIANENFDSVVFEKMAMAGTDLFVGLARNGNLYIKDECFMHGVSGFLVSSICGYLIISTDTHECLFFPLDESIAQWKMALENARKNRSISDLRQGEKSNSSLAMNISTSSDSNGEQFIRKVERGSRLVTVIDGHKLLLQMPRGNLETVYPRALVIYKIKKLIDDLGSSSNSSSSSTSCNYGEAFVMARKHRISTDLLYDYDPVKFEKMVSEFVIQVSLRCPRDGLNLFISSLSESNVLASKYGGGDVGKCEKTGKTNRVCQMLLQCMTGREDHGKSNLVEPILTAFVKMGSIDRALSYIKTNVKESNAREKAISYLIFLVDVRDIYKEALGTYDFGLTLSVLRQSQMDPKEHLPFLETLAKLPILKQKFEIDKFLKRWSKALVHLFGIYQLNPESDQSLWKDLESFAVSHNLEYDLLGLVDDGLRWRRKDVIKLVADRIVVASHFDSDSAVTADDDASTTISKSLNSKEQQWIFERFGWTCRTEKIRAGLLYLESGEFDLASQVFQKYDDTCCMSLFLESICAWNGGSLSSSFLEFMQKKRKSIVKTLSANPSEGGKFSASVLPAIWLSLISDDLEEAVTYPVTQLNDLLLILSACIVTGRFDLLESHILPSLRREGDDLGRELKELQEECEDDLKRLLVLFKEEEYQVTRRSKLSLDTDGAFAAMAAADGEDYGDGDDVIAALADIDLASEVSSMVSKLSNSSTIRTGISSVLSIASTNISSLSQQISTSSASSIKGKKGVGYGGNNGGEEKEARKARHQKRKEAKKKQRGRKGTIYEKDAILRRLLDRLVASPSLYSFIRQYEVKIALIRIISSQQNCCSNSSFSSFINSKIRKDLIGNEISGLLVQAKAYFNILLNQVSQSVQSNLDASVTFIKPLLSFDVSSLAPSGGKDDDFQVTAAAITETLEFKNLVDLLTDHYREELAPMQAQLNTFLVGMDSFYYQEIGAVSRRWKRIVQSPGKVAQVADVLFDLLNHINIKDE